MQHWHGTGPISAAPRTDGRSALDFPKIILVELGVLPPWREGGGPEFLPMVNVLLAFSATHAAHEEQSDEAEERPASNACARRTTGCSGSGPADGAIWSTGCATGPPGCAASRSSRAGSFGSCGASADAGAWRVSLRCAVTTLWSAWATTRAEHAARKRFCAPTFPSAVRVFQSAPPAAASATTARRRLPPPPR